MLTHVKGAPSIAVTLTTAGSRPGRLLYTWARALAEMPGGAGG